MSSSGTASEKRTPQPVPKKRKIEEATAEAVPADQGEAKCAIDNHGDSPDAKPTLGAGVVTRSELWFEDGNVIIHAGDTQFRVHQGMLSRSSAKWKENFAGAGVTMQDGVLVVHVPADAKDVGHLLHALYDSTYLLQFYHGKKKRLPLSVVMALTRLGDKYGFTQLRDEAVSRLYKEYPEDLDKWSKIDRKGLRSELTFLDGEGCTAIPFRLLMLAIERKMPTVLPGIYLDIYLRYGWDEVVNGVQCHDGTMFVLPPSVQVTCLLGFHKLRDKCTEVTYSWFQDIPSEECLCKGLRTGKCDKAVASLYYEIFGPSKRERGAKVAVNKEDDDEEMEEKDEEEERDEDMEETGEGEEGDDEEEKGEEEEEEEGGEKGDEEESETESDKELESGLILGMSQMPSSVGSSLGNRKNSTSIGSNSVGRRTGWEPWNKDWEADLCDNCAMAARKTHDRGRKELWEMLPELFGLPCWDDLKDFEGK